MTDLAPRSHAKRMTNRERFLADRRQTAVHEGGHAIAANVLGLHIESATIWFAAPDARGEVEHQAGSTVETIVVVLAGYAAEEHLRVRGPGPPWPTSAELAGAPGRDSVRAYKAAVDFAGPARAAELYERCYRVALGLTRVHWRSVQSVADLLMQRSIVHGREIAEEVARVTPTH